MFLQGVQKFSRQLALFFPQGGGIPLRALHVIDGDEGGFPANGQAHALGVKLFIHTVTQTVDG